MKITGFPALVVSVVVALVVFGAVMPIFADTTQAEDTFTNTGRYYVNTDIEDDVTITMDYDIEDNVRSWYIDGVLLEYDDLTGAEYIRTPTVAGTDNFIFRSDGRYRGLASATGNADYTVTVTNTSITRGDFVGNAPLFVASTTETDNIMRYSPDTDMYIVGDSDIIACGYTDMWINDTDKPSVVVSIVGNVDDGVTITLFNSTYQFTTSNVKVNVEEVDGYNDLYKFQSVTFDATYNDGTNDYVTSCTYSMVVLPAEVTAERAVHPDGALTAILDLLPFLIGAGLVVGAVAWFITRKG